VQGSQSTGEVVWRAELAIADGSQVFEDEVLSGTESADNPAEEVPERHDHGKNLIGTIRIELFTKSFILRVYDVLARHRS
jgi:hypothetical protein